MTTTSRQSGEGALRRLLPSKPQIDKEGQHKRELNGKPAYRPVLEWSDRDPADQFSAAIIALIRAPHPGDLGRDAS